MLRLFPITLLTSAFLLFCMQPMVARALVPLFGGSSSVWTACLLFFQAMLLLGYAYAHGAPRLLGERRHAALHVLLVLAPLLVLPIVIDDSALAGLDPVGAPTVTLLLVLGKNVALPFLVLSTTSPLLSRWYAGSEQGKQQGAYWLYAASNLGSLAALVAYPALIEPLLPLRLQGRWWQAGYGVFAALVLVCAAWVLRRRGAGVVAEELEDEPLSWPRRLRWVVWAAIPSSLLSGVTAYMTTDIASVPLLWVVPLGLYLLTFVLCFATRPPLSLASSSRALVLPAAIVTMLIAANVSTPLWLALGANLAMFFLATMVCHGRLAADRPKPGRLTEFFLWLSVGGVLGGGFNAIAAPLLFPGLIEYPLAMVLACWCRVPVPPAGPDAPAEIASSWRKDFFFVAAIGALTAGAVKVLSPAVGEINRATVMLVFLLPLSLVYMNLSHPTRFSLGLGSILLGSILFQGQFGKVLHRARSFYSTVRISTDVDQKYHQIVHGGILHGRQAIAPERRQEPTGYYHRKGPLGRILALPREGSRIGVVGLGVGTMAAHAQPGESWIFYEIDPLVAHIAEDTRLFSFLSDARTRGARVDVVLGDARLRIQEGADTSLDLLLLDAFSSDAIPTHLLTREALSLYLRKLHPRGRLGFHVSNRFLDLTPMLGALGADLGLTVRCQDDTGVLEADAADGKLPSIWCVAQRQGQGLEAHLSAPWAAPRSDLRVWTDDATSLWPVLVGASLLR